MFILLMRYILDNPLSDSMQQQQQQQQRQQQYE
jgi:hypothetical protein